MKYVFLVIFDWSTEDESRVEIDVYKDYDKAKGNFKAIIDAELDPNLSWVGSEALFGGQVNEGFELSTNLDDVGGEEFDDLYWEVSDENNSSRYSNIRLIGKTVY